MIALIALVLYLLGRIEWWVFKNLMKFAGVLFLLEIEIFMALMR